MSDEREMDDAIRALRAEMDRIDASDPESRERLETLYHRLQLRLERREQGPVDQDAAELLETLEARYPQLTLMVNDIMMRLAAMGI